MKRSKYHLISLLVAVLILTPLLGACSQTAEPTSKPADPTSAPVEETAETTAETAAETVAEETSAPTGPQVGGTLVLGLSDEPNTLDANVETLSTAYTILSLIGGTLVGRDANNQIVPYLAESWDISEDGLTWDFYLRQDVKFHDGTPLTAEDFAWTYMRAKDPEQTSGVTGRFLAAVDNAEAIDEYTLRLTLNAPLYPHLTNLSLIGWLQPLSREAVEAGGESYGRNPIGVGPYKFKEWRVGERIVLERNPDFTWGPDFTHGGPPFIETIEFRIIPDDATRTAGLETGEIDWIKSLAPKDLERIEAMGQFQFLEVRYPGANPLVYLNNSKPPFDDILVRQAFNYAVNREVIVNTVSAGHGDIQHGPVGPGVVGYWPGIEEMGYPYDPEQAIALLEQAGYTMNADGMMEKDGEPFKITLKTMASEMHIKTSEILQQQFKAIGVDVELQQEEIGILVQDLKAADYEAATMRVSSPDIDLLYLLFHSSLYGHPKVSDPEFDILLEATRTTMDPVERQLRANEAQQYVVEHALMLPLYAVIEISPLSLRVKDAAFSPFGEFLLFDAYIEE